MKVLYSVTVFPGISETFILNEILEVQNQGVEVVVFARSKGVDKIFNEQIKDVKEIYYSKKESVLKLLKYHLQLLIRNPVRYLNTCKITMHSKSGIKKLFLYNISDVIRVKKIQPDIIHAHFGGIASNFAMLCKLLFNTNYTFTTHRWDIFDHPPGNYLIKTKLSKKHITISNYNRNYLIEHFQLPKEKIEIIHCGIDFTRKEFSLTKQAGPIPQILNVGRLSDQKNQKALVEICKKLKEARVKFLCKIIGEGENRKLLEDMISLYDLTDDVILLGPQTQNTVFDELSKTDVFVLTSISEGIPVCLMEAMAMKVPVVSSNVNGIPELIDDEKDGFLCDVDNLDCFVQKIIKALEAGLNVGYDKVYERYNLKKEVNKLIKLWRSV